MKTDNETFMKKCEDCVKQSQIDIYKMPNHSEDNDPNYLLFDQYNEETHGTIRQSWLQQKVCILLNKHYILELKNMILKLHFKE